MLQGIDVIYVWWGGSSAKLKLIMWGFVFDHKTIAKGFTTLVAWEFDAFCCYHVDVDNCKCALPWWCREEHKFLIVGLLVQRVLGNILASQIVPNWNKDDFSINRILTAHRGVGYNLNTCTKLFLWTKISLTIQGLGV